MYTCGTQYAHAATQRLQRARSCCSHYVLCQYRLISPCQQRLVLVLKEKALLGITLSGELTKFMPVKSGSSPIYLIKSGIQSQICANGPWLWSACVMLPQCNINAQHTSQNLVMYTSWRMFPLYREYDSSMTLFCQLDRARIGPRGIHTCTCTQNNRLSKVKEKVWGIILVLGTGWKHVGRGWHENNLTTAHVLMHQHAHLSWQGANILDSQGLEIVCAHDFVQIRPQELEHQTNVSPGREGMVSIVVKNFLTECCCLQAGIRRHASVWPCPCSYSWSR